MEDKKLDIFEEFKDLIDVVRVEEPTYVNKIDVKYDGIVIIVNKKEYVLPSLSVGQFKRLSDKASTLHTLPQDQQLDFSIFLTFIALSRNYENVKREWIEENIPPHKISEFINYIMSGIKSDEAEEYIQKKS